MKKTTPTTEVEIVTAAEVTAADLKGRAETINEKISIIKGHQGAFEEATLEHRLCIGLELANAKAEFGITNDSRKGIGGRPSETLSPGDTVSNPLGFSAWLKTEVKEFDRSKADLYINAFQALGLSRHEATPKLIREKIKSLYHLADKNGEPRPSLKSLYKLGKPAPSKEPLKIEGPKDSAQLRLEDARETFHHWKEEFETALRRGQLDDLDKPGLEDLKEFIAGVRDRINARLRK
jgi:hypothetical protein